MLFCVDPNCVLEMGVMETATVHCVQFLVSDKLVFTGITVSECCIRSVIKCTVHEICHPITSHDAHSWCSEVQLYSCLTSALYGDE
jgi:hypothetical protein